MNITTRLKVIAEILLSITIIIMIVVAIKVISLGNLTGVQLLLSTVFFVMFMWLGWIQPKLTGVGLVLLGLIVIALFGNSATNPWAWKLLGSPFLITGLFFIGAGWKFHQTT